jgi:small subunit ribosomal protein S33
MAAVLPSRLTALTRLRCAIFQTSYNPTNIRTGGKYLRRRLRGPSMARYYPQELNLSQIARQYPELELVSEIEEQRLQDVEDRKKRGKGAPKKAKTKGQWRKLHRQLYIIDNYCRRKQENQQKTITSLSCINIFGSTTYYLVQISPSFFPRTFSIVLRYTRPNLVLTSCSVSSDFRLAFSAPIRATSSRYGMSCLIFSNSVRGPLSISSKAS